MDVAELIRLALAHADTRAVRFVHLRHIPEPEFLTLVELTHEFLWNGAAAGSEWEGWRVHPGGILRWWRESGDLDHESERRLHKYRSDVVDFLTAQGRAYRSHPQSNHLHVAPFVATPDSAATITVSSNGAGFGNPERNRQVEIAAMNAVTASYTDQGWVVEDVSAAKCGWDLTCRHGPDDERHLEVKGVAGSTPTFLLTANEHKTALDDPTWRLTVVLNALTKPKVCEFSALEITAAAEPYVYRCAL